MTVSDQRISWHIYAAATGSTRHARASQGLTFAKRTTGSLLAAPTQRSTTPRAPFTRPLAWLRLRVSMTWAPTFRCSTALACSSSHHMYSTERLTQSESELLHIIVWCWVGGLPGSSSDDDKGHCAALAINKQFLLGARSRRS